MQPGGIGDAAVMYADGLLPTLAAIARRAAAAEGLQIAWVELNKRAGSWVFRVFIEREDGDIGLKDCEAVSRRLSVLLDVEDPIESSYTLEVSSPGLDRPLHDEGDFRRFGGKLARVTTREAIDGRRKFVGRLAGVEDGVLSLSVAGQDAPARIPLAAIDKARLEVELDLGSRRKGR